MGPDARLEGGSADLMCAVRGHIWSEPYSFGGKTWHRDCHRCFTSEEVALAVLHQPARSQAQHAAKLSA